MIQARHIAIGILFLGLANGTAQAQQTVPQARPELLTRLVDCRSIADGGQRLACYDAAASAFDTAEKQGDVVVIDREQDLPPQYLLQPQAPPPMPDKKAIAAALKVGTPVPGAHAEQRVRLDIH